MYNVKVSVVIPTYNRPLMLKKAIESVFNQTCQDFEIIVVDDGSNYDFREITREYKDRRLRYVKLITNSGGSMIPRTTGINSAKGKYIAILDDDCFFIDKDKLALQSRYFDLHPEYVLVGTNALATNGNGDMIYRLNLPKDDKDVRKAILAKNCFFHSSVMYRRNDVLKLGGYKMIGAGRYQKYSNDYELWLRLGLIGKLTNLQIDGTGFIPDGEIGFRGRLNLALLNTSITKNYRQYYPNHKIAGIRRALRLLLHTISDKPPFLRMKGYFQTRG